MSIKEKFQEAVNIANNLKKTKIEVSNEDKLELYSLFKQATLGDNSDPEPNVFNLVSKAKWDAWNEKSGLNKNVAMKMYIRKIKNLVEIN